MFAGYTCCCFNTMRASKLILAILLIIALSAAPLWSQPHSVVGVASDDVLNIRADIDHTLDVGGSEIVGAIPHDATDIFVTGVSIDVDGAVWREVIYDGVLGWVNAHFLQPTSHLLEPPEALSCGGTEPFWNVEIDGVNSQLFSPEQETAIPLDELRFNPGIGRTDLWGYNLGSSDRAHELDIVVLYSGSCSDGMSDLIYDYDAFLLGLAPNRAPAHGCCNLKH